MAAMELEYIFRIAILLVVVAVVIGMILAFKDQISVIISKFLGNLAGNKQNPQFPKLIDKGTGTFTSMEIVTYIESCFSAMNALPVAERVTTDCYILKGNFNANSGDIIQGINDAALKNKVTVTADFSKGVAIVGYQDPEGTISVR
jgi:hypothetical protein